MQQHKHHQAIDQKKNIILAANKIKYNHLPFGSILVKLGSMSCHIQNEVRRGIVPCRGVNLGGWLVSDYWINPNDTIWTGVNRMVWLLFLFLIHLAIYMICSVWLIGSPSGKKVILKNYQISSHIQTSTNMII